MIDQHIKNQIDAMSHVALCKTWRFASVGDPLLQGEAGEYLKERLFVHFGGFTPQISKGIGLKPC